jgi:hypothetical protein
LERFESKEINAIILALNKVNLGSRIPVACDPALCSATGHLTSGLELQGKMTGGIWDAVDAEAKRRARFDPQAQ